MAYVENDGLVWKCTNGLRDEASVSSHDDVWDDTALIEAYDRAVKRLKDEIISEADEDERKSSNTSKDEKTKKQTQSNWKKGERCLALFSEDRLYYEALILSVDTENDIAHVRFDYYENEESVDLGNLLPLECKEELEPAIFDEVEEKKENTDTEENREFGSIHSKDNQTKHNWKVSDLCYVQDGRGGYTRAVLNSFLSSKICHVTLIESGKKRKVKIKELKNNIQDKKSTPQHSSSFKDVAGSSMQHPAFHFPPPPMPSRPLHGWNPINRACYMPSMPVGFSRIMVPPPPPPPPPMLTEEVIQGDEEALANMLMSWYMSGYHTGFYRGLQQSRDPKKEGK